ncbi:MAG: hypothetical protein WAO71_13475 [Gallionella sp.]
MALIYNWWSIFVRLANPSARLEAITSRPWLLTSVGRKTEHSGQTTLTLTGLHADFAKARAALTRVSAMLQEWFQLATEQLKPTTVWGAICNHLKQLLASLDPPKKPKLIQNSAHASG